jgi:peptidoglycan/LPS O-acetylase OafA/YrhL
LHAVPIFFATSGYLISASYESCSDLKVYVRNCVLRIYPALWVVILCTVAVVLTIGGVNFWQPKALVWAMSQAVGVIYTPQFLQGFGFGSYNGSMWTIPIELQFYLVLPVLYWVGGKLKHLNLLLWAVWGATVMLAVVWLQHSLLLQHESVGDKLFHYSFLPTLYIFVFGILTQRLQLHRSAFIRGKALLWLAGYMAISLVLPEMPIFIVGKNLLLAIAQ